MYHRYSVRVIYTLAVFLLGPLTALAQTAEISGTVTDETTGEPLPGVNILVQATQIGTITNASGEYEIELPPDNRTLVFTFIGYRDREVEVPPGQATFDVTLEEDLLGLDEVVVTGLASSVKRKNLANSVETISSRELAEVTTNQTFDGAINGKVTGAVITSYTGAPGGGIAIKLRGITTINGQSQPLFIVDGIILNNDAIQNGVNAVTQAAAGGSASSQDNPANRIADLNPEDIESIEILKGPSAAAIYGARASNGVVIITTKKGSAQGGGLQVSASQSIGFTTIANTLGSRQFTAETAENTFGEVGRELFEAANGQFVDYEEELFGNEGILSTTTLSASGGNERTQFYASGLIKDDGGIIERTGYEKQSARVNLTHRFSDRVSLDVTSNYVRSVARRGLTGNDNSGTTFGVALTSTPNFVDIRPDEDGNYPDHPFNPSNPLQTRDLANIEETTNRILASSRLSVGVFQTENQSLQAIAEGGADYFGLESSAVFPRELQFFDNAGLKGTSIQGRTLNLNTNLRGALVHSLSVPASNLFFTTQAGLTVFNQNRNIVSSVAQELVAGQATVDQAAALRTDENELRQQDRALFAQEEVNFDDRVIASVGIRAERSTLSGDVDQYFAYPKASLAVNVAEFPFWNVAAVDQLKFRAAFGQTGNTAPFGSRYTTFGAIVIGGNVGVNIGQQRGFADIEPERATEVEGGFDISAFDGRANLEFTVYQKIVDNLLLTREVPPSSGFLFETLNGGELTNRGLEVGASVIPINTETVRWVSRTSFWTNSAEVTELNVPSFRALGGGFGATLGEIRIEEGQSPTQIVGVDDTDGDGTADGTFQLGDTSPDFQMSFFNDVTLFRNLRLTVFGHWKYGGDVINLSELLFDLGGTSPDFDENAAERLGLLGVSARPFVQNASYFKLREVGLYYTLPEELTARYLNGTVRNVRFGISANNLFTITPYKSYDPEVNNFAAQPVATGVEVTPFPSARSFLFHFSFGL